ncbi:MAG: T9SS type A sorting domain-containing protein [candidate division WOR-3 bacterium]
MKILIFFLINTGWPFYPQNSSYPLGNNWGEYQEYGGSPYLHPGIDVMSYPNQGIPVYSVSYGFVKAWLTISGYWHWRIGIGDNPGPDSTEGWLYAHIDPDRFHVDIGDTVYPGDLIGYLVVWPVTGFDHCHFARIKDEGIVWQTADWAFVRNPLKIIEPLDDTVKPKFENALSNQKFAICLNNTSTYISPDSVFGDVDIIVKAYDIYGDYYLPNPVWKRINVFKISYYVRKDNGGIVIPEVLSFKFGGRLEYTQNVNVIFKDDNICNTRGDYNYRDFYYIITNTDGDTIIESSDAYYSLKTQDLPDGYYWIVVKLLDEAGNLNRDSMRIRIRNLNIKENILPRLILENLDIKSFKVIYNFETDNPLKIIDFSGRIYKEIKPLKENGKSIYILKEINPGIYFLKLEDRKMIIVKKVFLVKF